MSKTKAKQVKTQTKKQEKPQLIKSAYLKNKLINAGIYMVFLLILLLVNYLSILGFKANIWILLDILLMVFFVSPIFFFKNTMFDRIYLPIIMFLVDVFITVNINYYRFFGVIFALKDLRMAFDNFGQAGDNINNLNWVITSINVALYAIALAGLLVFNIKFRFKEKSERKVPSRKIRAILGGIVLGGSLVSYEFSMGMWTIAEKNRNVQSIKFVNYNTNYHFRNMGMMSFYVKELRQIMFNQAASDRTVKEYLNDTYLVQDNYSNTLNNPNIFVLMIETGDSLMFNEYTTPNLYKLFKQQGVFAAHNYSYNHTNVSNTISITGNYPHQMLHQQDKYNTPFSLPSLLKAKNYRSKYYYDVIPSEDGYHDMDNGKNLGFDDCYAHADLAPDLEPWHYHDNDFIPDSVIAERIINTIKQHRKDYGNQPFYCNWMSMLMHMINLKTGKNNAMIDELYTRFGSKLKDLEAKGLWTNPGNTDDSKQRFEIYALKTMDFDQAVGSLMSLFYDSDDEYYKNTIFVAYGDHNLYETSNGTFLAKIGKNIYDEQNIKLYSTVLGMYHPALTPLIEADTSGLFNGHDLNKMTSPACIVPTILDLMGIKYNPKLYQDKSIFDLCGSTKYNKSIDPVYYSIINNIYSNENFSSTDGGNITSVFNDDGTGKEFVKKVEDKQLQQRVLDNIYHKNFFGRYKYEDFLPTETTNKPVKEVALVKYY